MIKLTLSIIALTFSLQSFATEQKVCEALLAKAEANCTEAMCEDAVAEGYECEHDGDFAEGHQICVYDGELPDLIKEYNRKNPRKKVKCEDI